MLMDLTIVLTVTVIKVLTSSPPCRGAATTCIATKQPGDGNYDGLDRWIEEAKWKLRLGGRRPGLLPNNVLKKCPQFEAPPCVDYVGNSANFAMRLKTVRKCLFWISHRDEPPYCLQTLLESCEIPREPLARSTNASAMTHEMNYGQTDIQKIFHHLGAISVQ